MAGWMLDGGERRIGMVRLISPARKVVRSLLWAILAAVGVVFCVLFLWLGWHNLQERSWPATPCTIMSSRVVRNSHAQNYSYTVEISYEYQVAGRKYTGQSSHRYGGYSEAAMASSRYPARTVRTCYVNPANPSKALLKPGPWWIGLIALVPLILVVWGARGLYITWRPGDATRRGEAAEGGVAQGPISAGGSKSPVLGMTVLFGAFLAMGGLFLYLSVIRPLVAIHAARSWPAVTCTVVSSAVRTHPGSSGRHSSGPTYSMDVLFTYRFHGRMYQSDRFDFSTGSSSDYGRWVRLVRQYPAGAHRTCYVNPANPLEAVLSRQFNEPIWVVLLVSLFPLVGLAGLTGTGIYTVRRWRRRAGAVVDGYGGAGAGGRAPSAALSAPAAGAADSPAFSDGPVALKRDNPRWLVPVFLLVFAAGWNGMVYGFLVPQVVSLWRGGPGWGWLAAGGLTLFAVPFILVGLATAGGAGYMVLTLFNPRCWVTVSRRSAPLGGQVQVQWRMAGNLGRLRRVQVYLTGTESAEFQRGTSTVTDTRVFARIPLAELTDPAQFGSGEVTAQIPGDTMHSFEAPHNQIKWEVVVHGEIPHWPDVKEAFAVTVTPLPPSQEVGA